MICATQFANHSSHMDVSAAVLLQFMLMMQTSMFAIKVKPMTFLGCLQCHINFSLCFLS